MQKVSAELSVEKSKTESLKKDLRFVKERRRHEGVFKGNSHGAIPSRKGIRVEAAKRRSAGGAKISRIRKAVASRRKDKTIAEVETEKDAALSEMAELQEVINDPTLKRNEVAQNENRI